MSPEKKLVLFDIDKTLTYGVKSHRAAFHGAFEKIYGVKTTVDIIDHGGMTDQQIVIEVLKKKGLSEKQIKAKLPECRNFMIEKFKQAAKREKIYAIAGAKELLEELKKREDVLLGLVTGNLEPIGWEKLRKAGLAHYFSFGAFGSDAIERSDLVKIAIRRAQKNYGFAKKGKVFLFGDTPRDVEAGKKANAITIGVATGNFSSEVLKKAGADFVVENLSEKEKILEIIYGGYKKQNPQKI